MKSFIVFIMFASMVFAQENESLKFFPYKTGDMWEYYLDDQLYPDTLQNFNIKDSIDAEGNIYLTQSSRRINPIQPPFLFPDTAIYKIDTLSNVFCLTCPIETKFPYKLNAQKGAQWVVYTYYDSVMVQGYEMARVREVWEDELFGVQTTFKNYIYYYASDSTDTLGLVRYADVLAKGFGLYWRGGGDTFGSWYLKGCVVDDTLYGDTTNVITSVKDLSYNFPFKFELYTNYPNPFNPSTVISYAVKEAGLVKLKVYDILGSEVAELVNETKEAGNFAVEFNTSDLPAGRQGLPSGVYIYTLQVNEFTASHKMLLLK